MKTLLIEGSILLKNEIERPVLALRGSVFDPMGFYFLYALLVPLALVVLGIATIIYLKIW